MTDEQLQQIKDRIIQELESLRCAISKLEENAKPISPECAIGTLGRFELMHDMQVDEKALHDAKIRINKLEYALANVDKDGYGECRECEEEILFERLMILPESLYCTKCAASVS